MNLRRFCYTPEIIINSLSHANIVKLNEEEIEIVANVYTLDGGAVQERVDSLMKKTDWTIAL